MSFGRDERAVTVVIGAVLMLGIAVAALAMYQANVVPDQNSDAEYDHHQSVREDMISFTDRANLATVQNTSMSQSVRMGPTYQTRSFAINAPPPHATVETGPEREITIEDDQGSHTMVAREVRYRPSYHYYDDAPDVVNYLGAVYHDTADGTVGLAETTLTTRSQIQLVVVQGDFSRTSASTESLRIVPVNSSTYELDGETTVTIETEYDGFGDSLPEGVTHSYDDAADEFTFTGTFDELRIGVVSLDVDEDDGGIGNPPFESGGGGDGGDGDGSGADPSFDSLDVRDRSSTSPPGHSGSVEYDVTYVVDDPEGTYDRVEATFDNADNPGASGTETSTATSGTLTHDPGSRDADHGDDYTITVSLFDDDGEVAEERCEIADAADGADPTVDC